MYQQGTYKANIFQHGLEVQNKCTSHTGAMAFY